MATTPCWQGCSTWARAWAWGGGAHPGLVGEEAAGHPVAHGLLHPDAAGAPQHGGGGEGAHKDLAEGVADGAGVKGQGDGAAQDVDDGHEGDDLLGERGDAADAADEDKAGQHGDDDAHDQFVGAKGGGEGRGDGVGLDHVPHKAQGEDDEDREEDGQHPAETPFKGGFYVVDRPADDRAVLLGAVGLCQAGLGKDGGHAEEGGEPHPEDGAGPAHDDGGGGPRQVAGAHLGGHGGGQGLKRAHAVVAGLFPAEADLAEDLFTALAEAAHLHESQAEGEIDARPAEQKEEEVVPEIVVCNRYERFQK